MASEPAQTSVPTPSPLQPLKEWAGRSGLSGKLLAIGSVVGLIAVFLPLMSMSMQMPSFVGGKTFGGKGGIDLAASSSQSVMVVRDIRGTLCLVGYLAALALAFVLYPPNGLTNKALGWAGVGVGGFVTIMALWLLVNAFGGSGNLGFVGFQVTVGIGAILNLLAGVVTAVGGLIKAREEKLF